MKIRLRIWRQVSRAAPGDMVDYELDGVAPEMSFLEMLYQMNEVLSQRGERMIAFADLARRYPEARLIFAGGSGSLRDQEHKESDFAPELMAALGIAPARVIFER